MSLKEECDKRKSLTQQMENEKFIKDEFVVNLTIDGTSYEEVEVKITDPNKTIRNQIKSIVSVFELPTYDRCGHPIQYILGLTIDDDEEPEILEVEDEDGHEQTLLNYGVRPKNHLHLLSVPAYACPVPSEMEEEIQEGSNDDLFVDDDFIINLTIEGTGYEDVEVNVTDPNRTLRDQIERITSVFDLPKTDRCGNPILYLLGQIIKENDDLEILEFDDEDGHEQTLIDYNIIPGDTLHLISVPIAGYACPVPTEMQNYWDELYKDL